MTIQQSYIAEIKEILLTSRRKAYQALNTAMVNAYWLIGKRIVEEEQKGNGRANYGEGLIKELSKALTEEFGKGFSMANLRNFRQFYLVFPDFEKRYTLCSELSWSHFRLIMRVQTEKARNYYIKECQEQNWSVRTLQRSIKTKTFERLLDENSSNQKNEKPNINDLIKDPYIFEFLDLKQANNYSEKELETALIDHLKELLLELGKGFSFVGRQFRIATESSDFYIDLVFYNYILKCFVVIDLKTGKLSHQDIGQVDMYVRMFDDLKKAHDDNPTIGIILCADKDETIVKYSVLNENKQLFASKYLAYLPSEEELQRLIHKERFYIEEKIKAK